MSLLRGHRTHGPALPGRAKSFAQRAREFQGQQAHAHLIHVEGATIFRRMAPGARGWAFSLVGRGCIK